MTGRVNRTAAGAAVVLVAALGSSAEADAKQAEYVVSGTASVTQGEKVVVAAAIWPNRSHPAAADGTIRMRDLEPVYTNSGKYRIAIPAASIPSTHIDWNGTIDVHLIISDGTTAEIQEVTAAVGVAAGVERVDLVTKPVQTAQLTADIPAAHVQFPASKLLPGLSASQVAAARAEDNVTRAVQPDAAPAAYSGCLLSEGGLHGPYNETFARVYGTAYVKGKVDQSLGSSHTIGVAVKGTGSWGASGTATVSTSAGYFTDFNVVDAAVINKVMQRYYYTKCRNDMGQLVVVATQSKPAYIHSGPYFTQVGHTNYGNCQPGYAGVTYVRNTTRQGSIGGGMSLGFVNVSAQSGWDAKTVLSHKFIRGGQLCGSNDNWMRAAYVSATA